jgi:signal transduction histidine kinase
VSDTGVGFNASSGSGMGLPSIRARLLALHGDRGTLSLCPHVPRGVRATIRLPLDIGRMRSA